MFVCVIQTIAFFISHCEMTSKKSSPVFCERYCVVRSFARVQLEWAKWLVSAPKPSPTGSSECVY